MHVLGSVVFLGDAIGPLKLRLTLIKCLISFFFYFKNVLMELWFRCTIKFVSPYHNKIMISLLLLLTPPYHNRILNPLLFLSTLESNHNSVVIKKNLNEIWFCCTIFKKKWIKKKNNTFCVFINWTLLFLRRIDWTLHLVTELCFFWDVLTKHYYFLIHIPIVLNIDAV